MMKKICVYTLILATFMMIAPVYVAARITYVRPDVYTTNYSNDFQFSMWVETNDNKKHHPPDYVSSIELTDPNGQVFSIIDPASHWADSGKGFSLTIRQDDYPGGSFPSGVYKIKVIDVAGNVITTEDTLQNANIPLPIPIITKPSDGKVLSTTTPLIRWTATELHRRFRITIDRVIGYCEVDDRTYYSPVWDSSDEFWTMNKFLRIPKGILRPGNEYRVRIDGRYNYLETDKRGRSDWLHFSIE